MKELTVALNAIKRSSKAIRGKYGQSFKITTKRGNQKDLCTEADILAEKIIINTIKKSFPDHHIIAEESGDNKTDSDYIWIIDPLDGTKNFVHQISCFVCSIALVKQNQIILGVISDPINNKTYWAEKGQGAYLNNKKIFVSQTKQLEQSFGIAEWWSRQPEYKERGIKIFNELSLTMSSVRYLSGTAWSLTHLAEGLVDIVTCDTTLLDIAASIIIIKEAGGLITDHKGGEIQPFDMSIKRIVASNPNLHKQVLNIVNQIYK
ncbi:MAG: inositol monophosphatase family protein [Patescibacteria group bacterium]